MTTINEIQDEIIEEFEDFEDWNEKYEYIIELGFDVPPMATEFKNEETRIIGCQSNAWMVSHLDNNGNVVYEADSEAMIVKGLISLLLRALSGQKPDEIANADIYMFNRLGLSEHLSPTRKNGLASMLQRIKSEAIKYASKSV